MGAGWRRRSGLIGSGWILLLGLAGWGCCQQAPVVEGGPGGSQESSDSKLGREFLAHLMTVREKKKLDPAALDYLNRVEKAKTFEAKAGVHFLIGAAIEEGALSQEAGTRRLDRIYSSIEDPGDRAQIQMVMKVLKGPE